MVMELSQRIRAIRERKGWTQNHLAVVSGIPQPTIWRLEKGMIKNPKSSLLQRLAHALDVSADYLLREDDEAVCFDEILRHDLVGQTVFRGYEVLTSEGREQVKSFVHWLMEEEKKKQEQP